MNECPTCHRPFGSTQRTCFACGRPILRNHQRVSVSVTVEEQDHPEAFLWLSHWAERKLEQRRVSLLQLRRRRVRAVLALLVWLTVMIQTGGK